MTIDRIKRQPRERRDIAMKTLMWVAHAMSTLDITALQHALGVDCGQKDLDHAKLSPLRMLKNSVTDFCQGLVFVQSETSQIQLVHHTLQEYLYDRDPSWFQDCEKLIAGTCLTYLLFDSFGSPPPTEDEACKEIEKLFPLYRYASQRWGIHIHRLYHHAEPSSLVPLMFRLAFSKFHSERAAQVIDFGLNDGGAVAPSKNHPTRMGPVHFGSFFGIPALVREALDRGHDINTPIEQGRLNGWTPLHFVGANTVGDPCGSWMSPFLIEKGADCHHKWKDSGQTPLHVAAAFDRHQTLKSMLTPNTDIEIADRDGWRPLHTAARYASHRTLSVLLDAGCAVEPQTSNARMTPLHLAVLSGQDQNIEILLDFGADLEAQDAQMLTPLHHAARWNQASTVTLLLDRGASINAKNEWLGTPLMLAGSVPENTDECVRVLIDRGAALDCRSRKNDSALLFAAHKGNYEAVKALIDAGADIDGKHEALDTALHAAASQGHPSICRLLLDRGVKVDEKNEYGNTALHLGADKGEIVRLLIRHHAQVNESNLDGETALHFAARAEYDHDEEETVLLLIRSGAEVIKPKANGWTPLHLAAWNGNAQICKTLLQYGASTSSKTSDGSTSLHLAAHKSLAALEVLVTSGSSLEVQDGTGLTPLHMAAAGENIENVRYLLQNGAPLNIKHKEGETALQLAMSCSHLESACLLIEYGADANVVGPDGNNVLHTAASNDFMELARVSLDHGVDVNTRNEEEFTPLTMACEYGHLDMVNLLLEKGADINASGIAKDQHWNGLEFAAQNGHQEIVQLLLEKGIDRHSVAGQKWSALHSACCKDNLEIVRMLLDAEAYDIDGPAGPKDFRPLHLAIVEDLPDIALLLVSRGADIEFGGEADITALYSACGVDSDGGTTVVQALLEREANMLFRDEYQNTCLHIAAAYGSSRTIKVLIEHGMDIECVAEEGRTPLMMATLLGKEKSFQTLLESGAAIEAKDESEQTCLHHASRLGFERISEVLIEWGASVNPVDKGRRVPLHRATDLACINVMRLLLDNGADVNAQDAIGGTPLHWAVFSILSEERDATDAEDGVGEAKAENESASKTEEKMADTITPQDENGEEGQHAHDQPADEIENTTNDDAKKERHAKRIEALEFLLQKGANPSSPNESKATPLHLAAWKNLEMTIILLRAGADPGARDGENLSPITTAAATKPFEFVKAFLENIKNYDGERMRDLLVGPLFQAIQREDKSVFHLLRSHGADVDAKDPENGETILVSAVRLEKHYEPISFLLSQGASPLARTSTGVPILLPATACTDPPTMRLLLSHGADIHARGPNGETALHWAMDDGPHALENLQFLLAEGGTADINVRDDHGQTPLILAADHGHASLIECLLDRGADVEMGLSDQQTPLLLAVKQGHVEALNALLKGGADVHKKGHDGMDAMELAVKSGQNDAAKVLFKNKRQDERSLPIR